MDRVKTIRYTIATILVGILACAVCCTVLLPRAARPQTSFTAEAAGTVNSWVIEPTIGNFLKKNYGGDGRLKAKAAVGTVSCKIIIEDINNERKEINSTLTDFVLGDDGFPDSTVEAALNNLEPLTKKIGSDFEITGKYVLVLTATATGYDTLSKEIEFNVYNANGIHSSQMPQIAGWTYGDSPAQLTRFPIPTSGPSTPITVYLNGPQADNESYTTVEAFNARLNELGRNGYCDEYTVMFAIPEYRYFLPLERSITFRIKKRVNLPTISITDFDYGQKVSYSIGGDFSEEVSVATFSVYEKSASDDLTLKFMRSVTLRGSAAKQSQDIFIAEVAKLEAGKYIVKAETFENETYGAGLSTCEFIVSPVLLPVDSAHNIWASNKKPKFENQSGDVATWQYGQTALTITASTRSYITTAHGTITFDDEITKTYYTRITGVDGDTKGERLGQDLGTSTANMPTDVGKYYVEFSVREHKNYYIDPADVTLLPFEITTADDPTFIVNPYVIEWKWNAFDKSVNLFRAVPTRGGAVSFTVKKGSAAVSGLENFTVNDKYEIIDADGELSRKLNALDRGSYTLEVYVAASGNYNAFTAITTFEVGQADNVWTVSPGIVQWVQYYFNAAENMPKGSAKYGDVVIEVRKKADGGNGELIYSNRTDPITDSLSGAAAGWYTFTATVARTDNYVGLSYSMDFQVFSESVDVPKNYWTVVPSIDSWVAGSTPSEPIYEALRGTVKIAYYTAVLQNGEYMIGDVLQSKPIAPGKYFMCAFVRDASSPQDDLQHDVLFDIFKRVNYWTTTPSLQNYTLAESRPEGIAAAKYTEGGGITYTYQEIGSDEILTELPETAGNYVMIVTATAEYCDPIEARVPFTVSLSQNSWKTSPTLVQWAEGYFNADVNTPKAVSQYGDVVIEVHKNGDNTLVYYATVNHAGTVTVTTNSLSTAAAGWYTFTATVTETATYTGLSYTMDFQVFSESADVPKNYWIVVPSIDSWVAGSMPSTPIGEALSGSATFTYYTAVEQNGSYGIGSVLQAQPTTPGKYFMRATASSADTQGDLQLDVLFEIFKRVNSWTTSPSIQNYTLAETPPEPIAEARYTDGGGIDIKYRQKDGGALSDKLPTVPGEYVMVVTATADYCDDLTAQVPFSVSLSENRWEVSPTITQWAEGYFDPAVNTPKGSAKYGKPVIEVHKKADNDLVYKLKNGVVTHNYLSRAAAGRYTFTAVVSQTATYTGLSFALEIEIFSESVESPKNKWVVVPTIESWIAGSAPSEPIYEALRGTVKIAYYTAVLQNGEYMIGDVLQNKPIAPGRYFMRAIVRDASSPQDDLQHDVLFDIFKRVNKWTVTPSILSYSLGDGPSEPVAAALYTDGGLTVRYRLKNGGTLMSDLPRVPGEYIMIVTATADYCDILTAQVPFTVSLSQNSWISVPIIKDWSSEEAASLPFGEAAVGNEHIVYTYARADKPNEIFTERPTEEGSYIMYATIQMEGYETLTAQWEFSITSPYSRTLLKLDIILGVVCCLFTLIAIVFAIKRSRM